ncbi:uncharacterized protein LOC131638832 [Vicia villosa]|uniref:uncharacterized protein LOC131638832 n=1 Tax=Vicia villosa TaxID=3911 RepID=UPI00273CB145|nr:uncharacterized protein LOC131638832 [Vicia villosa]
METKSFIFLFFFCALVIRSMTTESSKDEKQIGATKEFQNKIGFDYKKPWTTWSYYRKQGKGGKGGKNSEFGSGGNGVEEGAQGEGEENEDKNDKGIELEG